MKRSETAFVPISISAILLLGLGVSWGAVALGGMAGVYSWAILIPVTVPVLGVFGVVAASVYAWKYRRDFLYAGVAVWLGLASMWPALWLIDVYSIAHPASLTFTQPEVTVRLPSDQKLVVLWGGNQLTTNEHRTSADQRWAYDLAVEPVLTGSDELADYGCYGTEVVAPIAAEVWYAHDGEPDQIPGFPKPDEPYGNVVILKLSTGTFMVLAHLKEGSVAVKDGEKVAEGQRLGECGNSGDSYEPHLHIHHQRQDPKTSAIGLAEGLPLYFKGHGGDRMPRGGMSKGLPRTAIGMRIQHISEN